MENPLQCSHQGPLVFRIPHLKPHFLWWKVPPSPFTGTITAPLLMSPWQGETWLRGELCAFKSHPPTTPCPFAYSTTKDHHGSPRIYFHQAIHPDILPTMGLLIQVSAFLCSLGFIFIPFFTILVVSALGLLPYLPCSSPLKYTFLPKNPS